MKSLPPIMRAAAAVIIITILYACLWAVTHPAPPPAQPPTIDMQLPTLPLSQGGAL